MFKAVGMPINIILWFPTFEFNWPSTGPSIWAVGFYCTKVDLLIVIRAVRQRHTQSTGINTNTQIMSRRGSKRAVTEKSMFVLKLEKWVEFRLGGKSEGHWMLWEQCVQWLSSLSVSLSLGILN